MPSLLGKWIFSLTAVAPAFPAAALVAYSRDAPALAVFGILAVAGLLSLLCWAYIHFARKNFRRHGLKAVKIGRADDRVLEFLVTYLLPVFTGVGVENFTTSMVLTGYCLLAVAVAVVVAHGNAYSFNPLLAAVGYRFFLVEGEDGVEYLLLSRHNFHTQQADLTVKSVGEFAYLDVTPDEDRP